MAKDSNYTSVKYVLMDIEGTTSSVRFVYEVLFPYFQRHFRSYLNSRQHDPEVLKLMEDVRRKVFAEERKVIDDEEAVHTVERWVKEDRKETSLKELQGMVWEEGFRSGALHGHVYEDVPPKLKEWEKAGIRMGIYSSGSVKAQKLLFGNSEHGNLLDYFSDHFDTTTGNKKDAESYRKIVESLELKPGEILFLSDVKEELKAAEKSGLQNAQIVRPGTEAAAGIRQFANFSEIKIS